LVDEYGGLTELNQRNKHWEEVQRTFIAGKDLNVSLFDNKKYSNQKLTDGNKIIFDSGYIYQPVLYFSSCSVDPYLSFQNLNGSSAYKGSAKNATSPSYISGSTSNGYPLSGSYVMNLFNLSTENAQYLQPGAGATNFPSYSVQETALHSIQASLDFSLTLPESASVTWSLQVYKNNTLLYEDPYEFSATPPTTAYMIMYQSGVDYGDPCNYPSKYGWTSKNPALGEYLDTGDTVYSDGSLTTAININGYFAQYLDFYTIVAVYPITVFFFVLRGALYLLMKSPS
jgi:hypothetical protein